MNIGIPSSRANQSAEAQDVRTVAPNNIWVKLPVVGCSVDELWALQFLKAQNIGMNHSIIFSRSGTRFENGFEFL